MIQKQVIVIRNDLNMRKGKMVAQGAHAVQKSIVPDITQEDILNGYVKVPLNATNIQWFSQSFTKICVQVNSEAELQEVYQNAIKEGVPCSYIVDNGKTEFGGVKTPTAVAVGPHNEDLINKITGHLKLL